jgi:imidazole glycerol-phosphate synthase subunit HisH
MIGIVDYGVGNLLSIQNIIHKAGGTAVVTSDRAELEAADKLILPGVGAFAYAMEELHKRDLFQFLNHEVLVKKKMILGLCLGAQLMTQHSEEGDKAGFAWIKARTVKFDAEKVPVIPHMNWADVHFTRPVFLSKGFDTQPRFYFVHSYHFDFSDPSQVAGTAHHGYEFACAFQFENISGVQFHPEKSHRFGIRLFQNFIAA